MTTGLCLINFKHSHPKHAGQYPVEFAKRQVKNCFSGHSPNIVWVNHTSICLKNKFHNSVSHKKSKENPVFQSKMYSVLNTEYLEYTIIIFILGSISVFTGGICFLLLCFCCIYYEDRDRRIVIRLSDIDNR